MAREDVIIPTRDGGCPAAVFTPDRAPGPWPAVIWYMDGIGVRAAIWTMAQRMADAGYLVVAPDLYHRLGPHEPRVAAEVEADPAQRAEVLGWLATLNRERKVTDTDACLAFLDGRPDVAGRRCAVIGQFLGGNAALTAAGAFPERIAAAISFHGADLATDRPDSPHLDAPRMTARLYVAAAEGDTHFPDEQRLRLETALSRAGVDHRIEIYPGVRHGFAVPDLPAFDPAAAERHWTAVLGFLRESFPREAMEGA